MRVKRPGGVVLVTAGLAAVGGLAALLLHGTSETSGTVAYDPANGSPRLLAVDDRGAVVTSPTKTWGVRRDGSIAWTVPATELAPLYGVCAPTCPAAVLSGDTNAINSPLAEDPPPMPVGGGSVPEVLLEATGGKAAILSLVGGSGLRLGSDADGAPSWTASRAAAEKTFRARASVVDWFPANDASAALVSTDVREGREQQVWVRDDRDGWHPSGSPDLALRGFGCVSRDAARWATGGGRLVTAGRSLDLGLDHAFSNCGFTADRLVTMDNRMFMDQASSHLRVFDLDGRLVRDVELTGEIWLATDVRGRVFATVGGGRAVLYDGRGQVTRTIPGVVDGRWTAGGTLVTVSRAGRVTWR